MDVAPLDMSPVLGDLTATARALVAASGGEWKFAVDGPWAFATPVGVRLPGAGLEAAHLRHRGLGRRRAGRHRPRPRGRGGSVQVRRRPQDRPAPQLHPRRPGVGREVPHHLPGRRRPGRPPGRGLPPGHRGPGRAGHPLRPGLPAGQPGPLPLRRLLRLAGDRHRRHRRPPDQGSRRIAAARRAHAVLPGAVVAGRPVPARPTGRRGPERDPRPWSSTAATASRGP